MKRKSSFSLNPVVADEVGCTAAVILDEIAKWVIYNANTQDKKYYRDGRYWTYGSRKYWSEIIWFISEDSFKRAIVKLEEAEYILKGTYNEAAFDRTTWYTLAPKAEDIYLLPESEKPKRRTRRTVATSDDLTPDIMDFIVYWNSFPELRHIDTRGMRLGECQDINDALNTYGLSDLKGIIKTFYGCRMGWYAKNDNTNNTKWLFARKNGIRNIAQFADLYKTERDNAEKLEKRHAASVKKHNADYRLVLIETGAYDPDTHCMDWAYFDQIKDEYWDKDTQDLIEEEFKRLRLQLKI